ncbi:MAG: hypothetical protein LBI69_02585 [Puniceicoccales bacterium]|nr:hypothetical protein [Puniceicoccales bacterium]
MADDPKSNEEERIVKAFEICNEGPTEFRNGNVLAAMNGSSIATIAGRSDKRFGWSYAYLIFSALNERHDLIESTFGKLRNCNSVNNTQIMCDLFAGMKDQIMGIEKMSSNAVNMMLSKMKLNGVAAFFRKLCSSDKPDETRIKVMGKILEALCANGRDGEEMLSSCILNNGIGYGIFLKSILGAKNNVIITIAKVVPEKKLANMMVENPAAVGKILGSLYLSYLGCDQSNNDQFNAFIKEKCIELFSSGCSKFADEQYDALSDDERKEKLDEEWNQPNSGNNDDLKLERNIYKERAMFLWKAISEQKRQYVDEDSNVRDYRSIIMEKAPDSRGILAIAASMLEEQKKNADCNGDGVDPLSMHKFILKNLQKDFKIIANVLRTLTEDGEEELTINFLNTIPVEVIAAAALSTASADGKRNGLVLRMRSNLNALRMRQKIQRVRMDEL